MQEFSKTKSKFINGSDPIGIYMNDIRNSKKLTAEEEKVLARRIRRGDNEALSLLVEANLKFVVVVCHHYEHQGLCLADLIAEGNLGLIEAARRFDETKNLRFISYAVWWIRRTILQALARDARGMRLSTSTKQAIQRINKAAQRLAQKLGRQPSPEELELETGLRAERIRRSLELSRWLLSLNSQTSRQAEPFDSVIDESESGTERSVDAMLARETADALLDNLDERAKEIVQRSFGVGGKPEASLADLARRYQMSRENIRQIRKKGMARLRSAWGKEKL